MYSVDGSSEDGNDILSTSDEEDESDFDLFFWNTAIFHIRNEVTPKKWHIPKRLNSKNLYTGC
jgi:hypothetical protein